MATADKETIIGTSTHIVGEVRGESSLTVKGRVDGSIELSESLTVEPSGVVQADVTVKTAEVSGVLVGSLTATEVVRLLPKSRVVGDIQAPRVAIDAGAAYRGRLEMGPVDLSQRPQAKSTARASSSSTTAPPRLAKPKARKKVAVPARRSAKAASPKWARKKTKRR